MAYDNADTALRFMASSYLELDAAQAEDMRQRIVQFHEWTAGARFRPTLG